MTDETVKHQKESGGKVITIGATGYTVRDINVTLMGGSGYCYVDMSDGRRFRISRARVRNGVAQGRIILGSERTWEALSGAINVELTGGVR